MSNFPHPELLEDYEALLAKVGIERKGKNNPYTSINGHMYSFVSKEGQMAIRLSREDREAFLKKYDAEQPVTYNTVMKEYVAVPAAMTKDLAGLSKYMKMSLKYTGSLKPKPTTKKKK